jgi:hypothetical protein
VGARRDYEVLVLWRRRVHVDEWGKAEFLIEAPGIRENYPKLDLGDLMHLREVVEEQRRVAFEARVVRMSPQKESYRNDP